MRFAAPLLAVALVAGCLGGGSHRDPGDTACLPDPHPCGPLWPDGLTGPFALQAGMPQAIQVPSHDGTLLRGWLYLPGLPEGVRAPVLLVSSPYYGLNQEPPGADVGGITPTQGFVENGYAVAAFSVRGTGVSDGCFGNKDHVEQMDQVALVAWAASQPWSNGRVAMGGTSYPGTTPLMAAIHQAPGLATIVINGPVTDPYTELHTPQGALYTMGGPYEAGRRGLVTAAPLGGLQPNDGLPLFVQAAPDRICPDLAQVLAGAQLGIASDDRDGAFWSERQLVMHFPTVTAAVFLSHGFQETAHPFQEDVAWDALRAAPKRMLLGQWDHELPRVDDWQGELIAWLDYWLKGLGTPDSVGVGSVVFQDDAGAWHNATSWPPSPPIDALYLGPGGELTGMGPDASFSTSFRSVPPPPREHTGAPLDHLCGSGVPGTALVLPTLAPAGPDGGPLAGNPFLRLMLESDLPGGIVSAHLFRQREGEPCESASLLTSGAADLRFHAGGFTGSDFPVGTPTPVRIDLNNVAAALQDGDRLALVLSYGDSLGGDEVADPITDARVSRGGQPYYPTITVHAVAQGQDSFLALPGQAFPGGPVPTDVPPRPFTPL